MLVFSVVKVYNEYMKKKGLTLVLITTIFIVSVSLGLLLSSCVKSYPYAELQLTNIAANASVHSQSTGKGAKLIDSNVSSNWQPKEKSMEWVIIDLASVQQFNSILLRESETNVDVFRLEVSDDAIEWDNVYIGDGIGGYKLCTFDTVHNRYIKLIIDHSRKSIKLGDLQVFNASPTQDYFYSSFIDVKKGLISGYNDLQNAQLRDYYVAGYDEMIINNLVTINRDGALINNHNSLSANEIVKQELNNIDKILVGLNVSYGVTIRYNMNSGALTQREYDNILVNLTQLTDISLISAINLEWANLNDTASWRLFNSFIKKFKPILDNYNIKLNLTLPANNVELQLDTIRLINKVYYNGYYNRTILNSDCNFYNTSYVAAAYLQSIGFDKNQIVLGLPFYGVSTVNQDIKLSWNKYAAYSISAYWQNTLHNLYYDNTIYTYMFNSYSLIKDKAIYAKLIGLGGIAAMNINDDVPYSSELSLSRAILV